MLEYMWLKAEETSVILDKKHRSATDQSLYRHIIPAIIQNLNMCLTLTDASKLDAISLDSLEICLYDISVW